MSILSFVYFSKSLNSDAVKLSKIIYDVNVLLGVPQGSILGPLLFVLFINDIFCNIDENSRIGLYADDTKLWRKIATSSDCDILKRDIVTLNN